MAVSLALTDIVTVKRSLLYHFKNQQITLGGSTDIITNLITGLTSKNISFDDAVWQLVEEAVAPYIHLQLEPWPDEFYYGRGSRQRRYHFDVNCWASNLVSGQPGQVNLQKTASQRDKLCTAIDLLVEARNNVFVIRDSANNYSDVGRMTCVDWSRMRPVPGTNRGFGYGTLIIQAS